MDNLVLYNGGYRILKGYVPFNDYWLITGPLLDYLNSIFFYLLGVSWKSFLIHSSLFNVLISVSTYLLLVNLNLKKEWSLFYSILFAVLMYPSVGTPFVDHHSTIFILLAFYSLIVGINNGNYFYITIIPTLSVLSFLSKQTPSAYGILGLFFLIIFYIILEKKSAKKVIISLIKGSIFSLIILFIFFYLTKINLNNFIDQYILYAQTIGNIRIHIAGFEILNLLIEFKFIFIFLIALFCIIFYIPKKKLNKNKHYFNITVIITFSLLMILHQKLTFNQNYIFFLIPLLAAFLHIYFVFIFPKKKILLTFFTIVCLLSVTKYHLRFNEHRKFNELENVNIDKAIDAKILHKSLSGLKWITANYPNNPKKEINDLKNAMKIINQDLTKKIILTNYQFIAPALSIYDYSPNQWHHPTVSFPIKNQKYFNKYKDFFIKNINKNNILTIYTVGLGEKNLVELILDESCFEKKQKGNIVFHHKLIKYCKDLK